MSTVDQSARMTRPQLMKLARHYGIRVGRNVAQKQLQWAVASCMQEEWYKLNGKEVTAQMAKRHAETVAKTEKDAAETAERKKRKARRFVFEWDEERAKRHGIERKKGQYKLTVDILRAPQNEGREWTADDLADEIARHPDLETRSNVKKIANYYVFELKNAGLIRHLVG